LAFIPFLVNMSKALPYPHKTIMPNLLDTNAQFQSVIEPKW
jgi:hypothetical protein